jgi:putative transposase
VKSRSFETVRLPKDWPKHVRAAILHVIALAQFALVHTRSLAANSLLPRVRLKSALDEAEAEIALLREEVRIKDARLAKIDARRRPHYPPAERLAILQLRAARHWSTRKTAQVFLVEPATIALWMKRLDEEGEDALVATPIPVSRFPEFVRMMVTTLRSVSPFLGKVRLSQILARAGVHLAATTVRRMLADRKPSPTKPAATVAAAKKSTTKTTSRPVVAQRTHHVWQLDLSLIPTRAGFWVPWPFHALHQSWPFCWWIALVIDQHSRHIIGYAVFNKQPTSIEVRTFLGRAMAEVHARPKYLIMDLGPQFTASDFRAWCKKKGVTNRYASKGSLRATAVVERFFLSLKSEFVAYVSVALRKDLFRKQLGSYVRWYHESRPHSALGGRTPDEVYFEKVPAQKRPRFEPRARWPRSAPCAGPPARMRAGPGKPLELVVDFADRERHLPVAEIRRVA